MDAYQRHSATEVAVMSGMSTVAGDAVTDFYGSGTMALGKIQTGSFVKVQGVDFGKEHLPNGSQRLRMQMEKLE